MGNMKKAHSFFRSFFGWLLIVVGGLFGATSGICALCALFGWLEIGSIAERLAAIIMYLVMTIGFFVILRLGIRLKNGGRRDKTASKVKREYTPAKQKETQQVDDIHKKLKQESDTVKEQEIAAEREKMKKIYHDFINGEGRLPKGFSEKYNRTINGYFFHKTPFEEYLDKILITIDSLNDRTGISDWIYFDGNIEINAAIEMIIVWVRRHREMNTRLRERKVGFMFLKQYVYCEHKIMVVMENADVFQNITEKSIASCKAEQISFCTILSEYELYDLIEQKAKTIEYITYPGYHDETYADWWFEDSPVKQGELQ